MPDLTLSTPEVARFTRRLTVLEEPAIAARLEELARQRGYSLGAEIRHALRFWLQQHEDEP
jgi:hypothetical protein